MYTPPDFQLILDRKKRFSVWYTLCTNRTFNIFCIKCIQMYSQSQCKRPCYLITTHKRTAR